MYCTKCGYQLTEHVPTCPNCKSFLSYEDNPSSIYQPDSKISEIPTEIKSWNWGAFMFGIFWGIGNYTYLPLLCFIPIFNIIWIFVCGAKGNEWAWKSGKFTSVESFLAAQKTWNRAGLASFIFSMIFAVLYTILMIGLVTFSLCTY